MISDALSEASEEIDRYLREMPDVYDPWRNRILGVKLAMDALRAALDEPPRVSEESP